MHFRLLALVVVGLCGIFGVALAQSPLDAAPTQWRDDDTPVDRERLERVIDEALAKKLAETAARLERR